MTTTSFRDVERLSAYLDGELSQAEQRRLEARLRREMNLAAALDELRAARALLRRTPRRRAPRNFMLTPKMAGLRPPLPRAVPALRLASVVAALLLFFTFAGNLLGPISFGASAPAQVMAPASGYGGGVGGGPAEAATEAADTNIFTETTPTPEANYPPPSAPLAKQTGEPGIFVAEQPTGTPEVFPTAQFAGPPTATPEVLRTEQPVEQATATPDPFRVEQSLPTAIPAIPGEQTAKPPFRLSPLQIGLLALVVFLGGAAMAISWQAKRVFEKNVKRGK
jgi:hypothetical protein